MSAKVGKNLIQFNQIIFDSKHSCLCSIGYINFFKDIRNVIFYCSLTDIQRCCNFLIEHSVSNLNKYFQLSLRQTVDFFFVNISGYQSAVQCRYQTGRYYHRGNGETKDSGRGRYYIDLPHGRHQCHTGRYNDRQGRKAYGKC